MSTFTGLTTMVRGIYMNQLSLNTVGHNIVNASNEGYSRQFAAPVATQSEHRSGLYGAVAVGTGVEALSLTRSRDTYADFQYRQEATYKSYYEEMATSYDKLEAIFNDSGDTGMANALSDVFQAWSALSTEGPTAANRETVIEKSKILCDTIKTVATDLQDQINSLYGEIKNHTEHVDEMMTRMVSLNKQIVSAEADGSMANDLRDQRDVVADELAEYFNLSITEDDLGAYQIVGNGIMLVNGFAKLTLKYDDAGVASSLYGVDYGVNDHLIKIVESDQVYTPSNGILKAHYDAIDDCKKEIDNLANISAYLITALNDQHAAGYDMNGELGRNFFGVTDYNYVYEYDAKMDYNYIEQTDTDGDTKKLSGIGVINALKVNSDFDKVGGYKYVAAATAYRDFDENGEWITYTNESDMTYSADSDGTLSGTNIIAWGDLTGDGTNAVYISELFNMSFSDIVGKGRANAAIIQKYTLKDKEGVQVKDADGNVTYITPLGLDSVNAYYQKAMTQVGVNAEAIDNTILQHEVVMTQIENWRDSVAGVDWNEELSDMIKYQKGFQSCARCLTAMDECLDRLVNNTGVVGR